MHLYPGIDIDQFKLANDWHGQIIGDRLLAKVCAMVQASLRFGDILGRYGGEEFVAALPDTGLPGPRHVAESVRRRIAVHFVLVVSLSIQVTLSIRIAQVEPQYSNL